MHSPLFVTRELLETRYQGAEVIFLAGSVTRGEANTYSDLDLVVVYPKVKNSYQESFFHREWPVEAAIHDPSTIRYFFEQIERPSGYSSIAEMIHEGLEVPGVTPLSESLKSLAQNFLQSGPEPMSKEIIDDRRYHISVLLDDIREPRTLQELIATATLLYNEMAIFYFLSRGAWIARGKNIFKKLKKQDPVFSRRFAEAFDLLFATGRPEKTIELAEDMLSTHGGILFADYRREVPSSWRK